MASEAGELESLVKQVIEYKGPLKRAYIERYNKNWLMNNIEETDQIQKMEQIFRQYDAKGIDLIDFCRAFLNMIQHEEDETLYIVIALIDLFKDICETFNLSNMVNSKDVLNYIVENFLNKNPVSHTIPTRMLPEKKKFNDDPSRIREIDTNAPVIYGNISGGIKRLQPKIIADRTHHQSNIKRACYSEGAKRIFTLESLGDHVSVYDLNCILDKKIYSKNLNEKGEIMILDFAWSEKQQRIGAVLKDFTISFWDAYDDYSFEKKFLVANFVADYQTQIWYIDFLDTWMTTDKTHSLNIWDIERESKVATITSPKFKSNIISVVPLDVLKLVAVVSLDKIVTIWDFKRKMIVVELDLTQGGIHTVVWSASYHVLITAGYENNINLWTINPNFLDITLQGKLIGHSTMVTAVQVVEKTPMVVSADDQGHIKVWDIRNLNCVQTLNLGLKSAINQLIDNYKYGKLCFVGLRVNFLEYDEGSDFMSNGKLLEQQWPIHAEYNFDENEIIICTRKDIRFVDIETGRCKKIYTGLLKGDEDEISVFKLIQQNKKFILGSYKGFVNLYSYGTGEFIKSLENHNNAIVAVKVDYTNNLIVTTSWDSHLYIQKETSIATELKRHIKNLHHNKEVVHMELSVYHSILITTTHNNLMYVWDYEYGRLIASIEIDEGCEPTFIHFINGYSYLIIGDTSGKVNILHFTRKDTNNISFTLMGYIEVSSKGGTISTSRDSQTPRPKKAGSFATRGVVQMNRNSKTGESSDCKLYISTNKGVVKVYDLSSLLGMKIAKLIPHANTRSNYNADRIMNEDFLVSITYKITTFETYKDFGQDCLILNDRLVNEFKAHNDVLTNLAIVVTPVKKLLTCSLDYYVRIWTLEGDLLASLNINHPLPIAWTIQPEGAGTYQKKVLYALKVIETMFKRYRTNIFVTEAKKLSITRFIKQLQGKAVKAENTPRLELRKIETDKSVMMTPGVLTMKDEYSPRDLQFNKAKVIFQKELQGPSLRQMEITKRVIEAQKAWRDHRGAENEAKEKLEANLAKMITDDTKDRNEFMTFLLGDGRKTLMTDVHMSKTTKALGKKLDSISARNPQPRLSQKIYNNSKRRDSYNFITQIISKPHLGSIGVTSPVNGNPPSNTNLSEASDGGSGVRSPKYSSMKRPTIALGDSKVILKDQIIMSDSALGTPFKKTGTISKTKESLTTSQFDQKSEQFRSKSWAKVDFFQYAQEKMPVPGADGMNTLLPEDPESLSQRGLQYQRRVEKRKFNKIISKLDDNLKRSQINGVSGQQVGPIDLVLMSSTTRSPYFHSPQGVTSININADSKSGGLSPKLKHGRSGSLPSIGMKPLNFNKEMDDAKKWIESNWGMSMDGRPVGENKKGKKYGSSKNLMDEGDETKRMKTTMTSGLGSGTEFGLFRSLEDVFNSEKNIYEKVVSPKTKGPQKILRNGNNLKKKTMFF